MQNGPMTIMNTRQPRRQLPLLLAQRWTSNAARPEPKSAQNAQRNYERYVALALLKLKLATRSGRELLPVRRTLFQIDALGLRTHVSDFASAVAISSIKPTAARLPWRIRIVCLTVSLELHLPTATHKVLQRERSYPSSAHIALRTRGARKR